MAARDQTVRVRVTPRTQTRSVTDNKPNDGRLSRSPHLRADPRERRRLRLVPPSH